VGGSQTHEQLSLPPYNKGDAHRLTAFLEHFQINHSLGMYAYASTSLVDKESIMGKAYSMDLRERVMADADGGRSIASVARKYRVNEWWIHQLKKRRR
jgi:hypothetical protein